LDWVEGEICTLWMRGGWGFDGSKGGNAVLNGGFKGVGQKSKVGRPDRPHKAEIPRGFVEFECHFRGPKSELSAWLYGVSSANFLRACVGF